MPRKGLRPRDRREAPAPDYKYNSVLVSRFVNRMNFDGKKTVGERILYEAMDILAEKTKENSLDVLTKAINNVRPLVEVKARRVGGANYQIPIEVKETRSTTLAMRWILAAARAEQLAEELLLAYKKEGSAIKKREDTHRMAEANRAFAHFRF